MAHGNQGKKRFSMVISNGDHFHKQSVLELSEAEADHLRTDLGLSRKLSEIFWNNAWIIRDCMTTNPAELPKPYQNPFPGEEWVEVKMYVQVSMIEQGEE